MPEIFKTQRRVEFRETDMAGIVHFSNFFTYMEQAEHAFLRSLGLGVVSEYDGKHVSWPRVNAQCDYRHSIRFEEIIDVQVRITRVGTKSLTYGINFFRDETPIADGSMTAVCCVIEHGKKPQAIAIPKDFLEKIQPFVWEEMT